MHATVFPLLFSASGHINEGKSDGFEDCTSSRVSTICSRCRTQCQLLDQCLPSLNDGVGLS